MKPRGVRLAVRAIIAAVVAVAASLVTVSPSSAALPITLTVTPAAPLVGQQVTIEASLPDGICNFGNWTLTVDGATVHQSVGYPSSTSVPWTFTTGGPHVVAAKVVNDDCVLESTQEVTVEVGATPGGSITAIPDPPVATTATQLAATPVGGFAPYTYAWDSDNDGAFDDESTRTISRTYPAPGANTLRVRVTDAATPANQWVISRTLIVSPFVPQPTPSTPPCTNQVAFGLSELTTTGCFARSGNQWSTTSEVSLNHLSLGDLGSTTVITLPTDAEPGGHLAVGNASIVVGDTALYTGSIDWSLPNGAAGDERVAASVAVPAFAKYVGLRVVGSAAVRIGMSAPNSHHATVSMSVEMPAPFGPTPDSRLNLSGSVRVDATGPHYEGMQLRAQNVYVGRGMRLKEVCFSAVTAGGQTLPSCPAPTLDGQPYLECATDTTKDRWEVSGILKYPDPLTTELAVFGAISSGELTRLGGFVTDADVPLLTLAGGVELNRIGAGVCLDPPPLKVRGDVGAKIARIIQVNGRFVYTDATPRTPWKATVGGNVAVGDVQLGDGAVTFDDTGLTSFAVTTDVNLLDAVTLNGSLNGWVEPASNRFNLDGSVRGCLLDTLCARAMALVSSAGLAGCFDAGTLVVYEPYNPRTGPFGWGSVSFSTRRVEVPLKAGFGYKYGAETVDLLGNSCGFGPYSAIRSAGRVAGVARAGADGLVAATEQRVRIAPGTQAITLLVRGTNGAPKVVLRGPGGVVVSSAARKPAVRTKRSLIAENPTNATTSVLLTRPAAGTWTISALPGRSSRPTSIARSSSQAPPMFVGQIRKTKKGRDLVVAYAAPKGATIQLVERGAGLGRVIASNLHGRACIGAGVPRTLNGLRVLCARVKFRPAMGAATANKRAVEALVTLDGRPIARKVIVWFTATR